MGMVAPQQRIASAFQVCFGEHGAVTRYAEQRQVCRQWVYREAAWVTSALSGWLQAQKQWRQQAATYEKRIEELERRLAQAVVVDRDKQEQLACVGQAIGVSLPEIRVLLGVLMGKRTPSVAKLGRWTKAAGAKAGALLQVLDEQTRPKVRQATADEIYVTGPVLMVVEPESLCWVSGRLAKATGKEWATELKQLPALEQVTRDAGMGLSKGIAEFNRQRQEQGQAPAADQLDHFHTLRPGSRAVGHKKRQASSALEKWEEVEAEDQCKRRLGQARPGMNMRLQAAERKATQAFSAWVQQSEAWEKVQTALRLITPEGELNARDRAEAALVEALAQLPDQEFAKAKRMLQQPETLTFLDQVHQKLQNLPVPAEVRDAAVRQEIVRRRPDLLQGENRRAAAMRGLLLICTVILAKAGEIGAHAVHGVRSIFRNAWRASSLVECLNSVLRMQQARHRKMSQGLLDLKRLYWNTHTFRTGRRRNTTPYQRLGLPWPEGLNWWTLLKWTPEQLKEKLSTPVNPK